MKGRNYINELAAGGEYYFTTEQLVNQYKLSQTAALAIIRRLREKKEIATVGYGFHLILPPEHRIRGSLPPEQFIHDFMHYRKLSYYVGLLSAAQFYGAAHQKPQHFQVVLEKNHPTIYCGQILIEFIARKEMTHMPTQSFKTPKGYVTVSTPEVTALDIVNYPLRSGGLNNVITVMQELAEQIKPQPLKELIKNIDISAQLQRLGFWLETMDETKLSAVIEEELSHRLFKEVLLSPKGQHTIQNKEKNKWKIIINEEWESDL